MKYLFLPRPHANSRYQAGALALAASEVYLLLKKGGVETETRVQTLAGVQGLAFECPPLDARQLELLRLSAHLYMLFEERDGLLAPLAARADACLGGDLPSVLKYKGKTNEIFTDYLLNLALCASDFYPTEPITALDPMCGRATSLFAAVNRGWNAVGVDADAAAIEEGRKYFKRYLEYHRVKHTTEEKSFTALGKQAALAHIFHFADSPERFKGGERQTLFLAALDSARIQSVFKGMRCQLLVADLPYGVQHAPVSGKRIQPVETLLESLLPVWAETLDRGGAMAISYNVNTLRPTAARGLMERAGLTVMDGPGYSGLEHWVEQAVTRAVAVAVKRGGNT